MRHHHRQRLHAPIHPNEAFLHPKIARVAPDFQVRRSTPDLKVGATLLSKHHHRQRLHAPIHSHDAFVHSILRPKRDALGFHTEEI